MTEEKEARLRAVVVNDIKPLVDAFVAESMKDPDLAAQSKEFRAGWEQGMREGLVAGFMRIGRR